MLWEGREREAFIRIRLVCNVNGNHVEQPNVTPSCVVMRSFCCLLPLTILM